MRRRGTTLLETLLGFLFGALILGIVYDQLVTLTTSLNATGNANAGFTETRVAIDAMVDHVRNATACTNSSVGVLDSGLHSGSATSFTYYGDAACTQVTYALSGTNLVRTDSGVSTIVARNVTAVQFTYYKAATYNAAWTTTVNPRVPNTAELPYVCGIQIDLTTNASGVTARTGTTVRLRNVPKKANLDGL